MAEVVYGARFYEYDEENDQRGCFIDYENVELDIDNNMNEDEVDQLAIAAFHEIGKEEYGTYTFEWNRE